MRGAKPERAEPLLGQASRYALNGLIATAVHYAVLIFGIEVLHVESAGLANSIAACFGIASSFLGSRYFVFRASRRRLLSQAARFVTLYAAIAVMHGGVLWLWTDMGHLDYRAGFMLATVFQVMLSYFGNRLVVFR